VVPIAASEVDYRYALSAVPFACLALGLACIRKPASGPAVAGDAPARPAVAGDAPRLPAGEADEAH